MMHEMKIGLFFSSTVNFSIFMVSALKSATKMEISYKRYASAKVEKE